MQVFALGNMTFLARLQGLVARWKLTAQEEVNVPEALMAPMLRVIASILERRDKDRDVTIGSVVGINSQRDKY